MDEASAMQTAIGLHEAGRLAEAEKIYREMLARNPNDADALHYLGVIARQTGRGQTAIDLIGRAIRLRPDYVEAHINLGNSLKDGGNLDGAIASYERAIQFNPEHSDAHNKLGVALLVAGGGQMERAAAEFERAVQLRPEYAEAHNNLGIALQMMGKDHLDRAIESFERAIAIKPGFVEVYNNLGNALKDKGQLDRAIATFEKAIQLQPGRSELLYNLGIALQEKRSAQAAIAAFVRAIQLNPDDVNAHRNLGNALMEDGQLDRAVAIFERAIQMRPETAELYNNLANALKDQGRADEALTIYRRGLRLRPEDAEAHSNLLLTMMYSSTPNVESIFKEHLSWNDRQASKFSVSGKAAHGNDRSPDRRLRVGYVSADFWRHSVGGFFMPVLEHHDRAGFEIFCYSNGRRADDLTGRMKELADGWREITGVPDETVARQIEADGIDILVDLSGHTAGNRLLVFARRPAPVQLTYLGYPNTTGMNSMDYRITDVHADPPGMTDSQNVEKLLRLPVCAWCYPASADAPPVESRRGAPITFGCFNACAKVSAQAVEMWAQLLNRVPGSRLILKSAPMGEASVRKRLGEAFIRLGISAERLMMIGRIDDRREHLEYYQQVDVALDSYPYHGTTTTCETLWMGVPVVTLAGRTHASRVGVSLLSNVGLSEMIANEPGQYVQIAADLAGDGSRLAQLRRTMRSRMTASPLMDARRFSADLADTYRRIWRDRVDRQETGVAR